MGSQVSSITCVALTQQQPLPQMPLQELLGKSLKHGTSPYTKPKTPATTKGVYFNSHSIGPSPRPTNSRATGPDPPSTMHPLVIRSVEGEELDSGEAANRAPLLPRCLFPLLFYPPCIICVFGSSVDSRKFSCNSNFDVFFFFSLFSHIPNITKSVFLKDVNTFHRHRIHSLVRIALENLTTHQKIA